ncbi:hypothetical protein IV102_08110 [bacterium]|nr:hypothetical protein [bacterium]
MSRPIHDKDARLEQARAIAAEQQAMRVLRAQSAQQQPLFQDSAPTAPRPSEIREISREGLIGSRRLAGDLEGMLRDKPKFFTPAQDSANSVGGAGDSSGTNEGEAQFNPFRAGERPSDLPVFNPGPRRPNQDENSRDLNLSQENRDRAMTQGVPTSATGRAAMEMFRQQQPQEGSLNDSQPAKATVESSSAETGPARGESAPATAPSAPDSVDPLLGRASTNFDRSQVSTAADSLGETRGVTDNELVLHRDDPNQAQNTIRQELGRQSQAEDESGRRAEHAQSTLDTSRGRERQLNVQREQLESAKAGQRSNADETQRLLESDNQRLEQNTRGVQQLQSAGESSLTRINSLDSQVEQNAQARDQAGSDLQSSEQSIRGLQSQVESLQRETPSSTPPGKSEKGNGNSAASAKAEQQKDAAAQSQQAITSAQSQLTQAQKQQEDARRRQQEAESSLQANQQGARQERERLDQTRSQLDQGVQARNASQSVAQQHKAQLQEDLDRVKDLTGHNQDINEQFDDIVDAKARAQASLESNRANASAARQNVEQLRSLSADSAFEDRARKPANSPGESGQSTASDLRPAVSVSAGESGGLETTGATNSGIVPNGRTQRGPGPSVQDQGEKTVVRLASLHQGHNSSSTDTSSGASKRRSGAEGGDDLGAASLAAASAASNPATATQSSAGEWFRDSGGRGKSDEDHGNGPPEHSNAGGNGKGRGKG